MQQPRGGIALAPSCPFDRHWELVDCASEDGQALASARAAKARAPEQPLTLRMAPVTAFEMRGEPRLRSSLPRAMSSAMASKRALVALCLSRRDGEQAAADRRRPPLTSALSGHYSVGVESCRYRRERLSSRVLGDDPSPNVSS